MPQNEREISLKFSRFGLILFIASIALFFFVAFVGGLVVGRNLGSYPHFISRELPYKLRQQIVAVFKGSETVPTSSSKQDEPRRSSDPDLTFYDRLTQEQRSAPALQATAEIPVPPPATTVQSAPASPSRPEKACYVQVASYREMKAAESLAKNLSPLGYKTLIEKVSLKSSGTWYRVVLGAFSSIEDAKGAAKTVEGRYRGVKCLIIRDKG